MADVTYVGADLDTKRVTLAYRVSTRLRRRTVHRWLLSEVASDQMMALVEKLKDIKVGARGGVVVAIEKPFLGKNPATYGKLMAIYGIIEAACGEAGVGRVGVYPSTWQTATLTVNGWTPKLRDDLKRQSKWVARVAHGVDVGKNDHRADAMNIAYYAMKNHPELEG